MAKRFTRNIKNIKNIEKQPKYTNEQNDLLSDENYVYVRNKDKYEQITGGVKEVNGETPDENGNVNLQLKDFTGQEKFVRKNQLDKSLEGIESGYKNYTDNAVEDIDINDRNLLLNSSNPLARWKGFKGSDYSAKQVDMTEEWGTENAYEFSISGGTDRVKVLYGTSKYVSEPMVLGQKYAYSIFVKNTGKNPFEFYINRLLNPESLENQIIQMKPGESKRLSFTGVRSKDYNSFQPMIRTRNNHVDDDLKMIMAMEKIQKGKATGWTPAPEDLVDEGKKYTDSQMKLNDGEIEKLKTNTETNTNDIGTLETNVSTNTTDIDTLQTNVSTNTNDIDTLQTNVSTNTSDIETLQTDYATKNENLSLNERFESYNKGYAPTQLQYIKIGNLVKVFGVITNVDTLKSNESVDICKLPDSFNIIMQDSQVNFGSDSNTFFTKVVASKNKIIISNFLDNNGNEIDYEPGKYLNVSVMFGVE